jgi:hypothetical protein
MSASELDLEPLFAKTRAGLAELRARKRAEAEAKAEAAKPKIVATVSPKLAEAIKANPTTLRVSARPSGDEEAVIDRPRRVEVIEVLEVDSEGRPARARRIDCMTGEAGVIDFVGGYRQPSGAVHEYNPLAGLGRSEDD